MIVPQSTQKKMNLCFRSCPGSSHPLTHIIKDPSFCLTLGLMRHEHHLTIHLLDHIKSNL